MRKPFNSFRRIGITGSSRSGKTVFLMSLIQHLQGGGLELTIKKTQVKISKFKRLPCAGKKNEFKYEELIGHLAQNNEWPEKTTDNFFYRCQFDRSDERLAGTELEFFDFPGERVADVTMIGKSYEEWSEKMLEAIRNDPKKKRDAAPFLDSVRSETPSETDILRSYKEALSRFVLDCHSLISPSTFLVDTFGKEASGATPDEIVSGTNYDPPCPRFSGLENGEFAPLPSQTKASEEVHKKFATNYKRYQREVVNPLTNNLLGCHTLIFLIDIADVLGSGVQKCNDTSLLIKELLAYIDQGMDFFSTFGRTLTNGVKWLSRLKPGWIQNIAFVASKADKVAPSDRDKLVSLLRDLAEPLIRDSELFGKAAFVNCISVNSTESPDANDHVIVGRLIWKQEADGSFRKLSSSGEKQQVTVSRLPEHWPDRWEGSDYSFYDFYPIIPAVHGNRVKQRGLERIMEVVLSGVEDYR